MHVLLSPRCRRRNVSDSSKPNSKDSRSKLRSQHHLPYHRGKLHHTESQAPTRFWLLQQRHLHLSNHRPSHHHSHLALKALHNLPCVRPLLKARARARAKTKMETSKKPPPHLGPQPLNVACLSQTPQFRYPCLFDTFLSHPTHPLRRAKTSA